MTTVFEESDPLHKDLLPEDTLSAIQMTLEGRLRLRYPEPATRFVHVTYVETKFEGMVRMRVEAEVSDG